MKYITSYTIEQIKEIIEQNTLPYTFRNQFVGDALLSKFKKNRIYLLKTGDRGAGGGQFPLKIKLIKRNDKVVLNCKFGFTLPTISFIVLFLCLVWVMFSYACFFNSAFEIGGKIITALAVILFSIFVVVQFPVFNVLFFRMRRRETFSFLEGNLSAKRY